METDIHIRKAVNADITSIADLNKKCLPLSYSRFEYTMFLAIPKYIVLVAEINKVIVGYIVGESSTDNYHIMSFSVDDAYRKKGIGTSLINTIDNNISLYVHTENTVAIAFYEKNKFTIVDTLHNYYAGHLKATSQDAFKMIRKKLIN